MDRLELMLEADRRGLLPPEKKAILTEAMKRGLVATPDALDQSAMEAQKPSKLERLGRGFADVTEGLSQAGRYVAEQAGITEPGTTDAYTKQKTEELKTYEKGQGDGIDWMRIGGNIAATLPVAAIPGANAATLGPRVAAGVAQGALASGSMFTKEGDSKATQTAIGGAFGGLTPVAIEGVKRALGNVLTRFTAPTGANLDATLNAQILGELKGQGVDPALISKEVMKSLTDDAKNALRMGGKLDATMLARKADIENVGATPFKAAITRNPRDWQTFQNLASVPEVGDDLVRAKTGNAAALVNRAESLGAATQGVRGTKSDVGQGFVDAITKRWTDSGDDVSAAYTLARKTFGAQSDLPRDAFAAKALTILDDFEDVIPSPIKRRLQEFGIDRMGVSSGQKAFTVQEGDELLKLVNKRWSTAQPGSPERAALDGLRNSLKETVLSVAEGGNDSANAFRTAWSEASKRFKEFEAKPIQQLIRGSIPTEKVTDTLMRAPIADLRQVKQVMGADGKQAWDGLRRQFVDGLLLKATGATSLDDVADKAFSGRNFSKALDAIEPEKLHLLFTPQELGAIRQLQRAAKALTEEVPFSDVNYSRSGSVVTNLLNRVSKTPLLGPLVFTLTGQVKGAMNGTARAAPVPKLPSPAGPIDSLLPGASAAALYGASQ